MASAEAPPDRDRHRAPAGPERSPGLAGRHRPRGARRGPEWRHGHAPPGTPGEGARLQLRPGHAGRGPRPKRGDRPGGIPAGDRVLRAADCRVVWGMTTTTSVGQDLLFDTAE